MTTEYGDQFKCDACEESYTSMRYLDVVETRDADESLDIVYVCRGIATCRDNAIAAVEEDRIARAERGRRLAEREEREAVEAAKPTELETLHALVEEREALIASVKKDREVFSSLRGELKEILLG